MSDAAAVRARLIEQGIPLGAAPAGTRADRPALPVPGLERFFPSGLPRSLHVMEAATPQDIGCACAVPLAVLGRLDPPKALVWITQALAESEGGGPYGPGLWAHGHDPARFLFVQARQSVAVLWAVEECLRSRSVGAVVGEVHDRRALDLTATRRIALRSERAGVPAFLVCHAAVEGALAARSRWRVAAAPSRASAAHAGLLGEPSWMVEITKNRDGPCGRERISFSRHTGRFILADGDGAGSEIPAAAPAAHAAQRLIRPAVVRLAAERRRRAEAARVRS